jgi:hypothetical protein
MVSYLPPSANLSIFNPQNFGSFTDAVVVNSATLKTNTDLIQSEATAQNTKFLAISSNPAKNVAISFSGSFNVGATGVSFTMPYTLSSSYYYIINVNMTLSQIGAPLSIQGVTVVNNWLNTTNSWSCLIGGAGNIYGFPAIQYTIQGLGTNIQPTFKLTFPTTAGYSTNTNTFTASGYYSIIGIKVIT